MSLANEIARVIENALNTLKIPASQLTGEIPAHNLPPGGNTGGGFTPADHASTHATGGGDALTPSDIGAAAASHTHTASAVTDLSEAVDDRVASLLVAGSNVTLTYNDGANTLTIAASGGGGGGSGNLDGGAPDTDYGGTTAIDGGTP